MMAVKPIDVLIHYPLDEKQQRKLAAISPQVRLTVAEGDDPERILPDVLEKAEVMLTANYVPRPESAPRLKWIQFSYAGIDFIQGHPILERTGFKATTLSGAAAPKVAEFAMMALLALCRA